MELSKIPGGYAFDKELNSLDRFVLDYVSVLDKEKIKYVIVSGYVAILFGRSKSSEDVDMIVEKISREKFFKLWDSFSCKFECLTTKDPADAFGEYSSTTPHCVSLTLENSYPIWRQSFLKSLWTFGPWITAKKYS